MHADIPYAQGISGAGVKLGILDSGIDSKHLEFDSVRFHPVIASGHYLDGSAFSVSVIKNNNNVGHGTKVSGVIRASRNVKGMHGVDLNSDIYVGNTNQNGGYAGIPKNPGNNKEKIPLICILLNKLRII